MTRAADDRRPEVEQGRAVIPEDDRLPASTRSPCARCGGREFLRLGFGAITAEAVDDQIRRHQNEVPQGERWMWTAPCEACGDPAIYVCRRCSAEFRDDGAPLITASEGHCSCGPVPQ